MKTCSKCKSEKADIYFHKSCVSKDGLTSHCKECRNNAAKIKRVHIPRQQRAPLQTSGSKTCSKCGINKDISKFDFQFKGLGGLRSSCKECRSAEYKETRILKRKQFPIPQENKKFCTCCERELPLHEFSKCSSKNSGYMSACKKCRADYYFRDRENILIRSNEYYSENKTACIQRGKEYTRHRRANDSEYRLRLAISSAFNCRLKYEGIKKVDTAFSYTGIKISEYVAHLKQDPYWVDYKDKAQELHIDHIIPCAFFDFTDPEEIKKCWNPRNLRLLPAKENLSKSKKFIPELVTLYGIEDLLPAKLSSI